MALFRLNDTLLFCANAAISLEKKIRNITIYPHRIRKFWMKRNLNYLAFFAWRKNVFSAIVKHAIDTLNEGIMSASVRAKFPDYERALEQQHTRL